MTHALCLAVSLVMALVGSISAEPASLCPRGLHALLDSPACSGHRLHMFNAPRTTIDAAVVGDVCVDSLRLLLLTPATAMPCTASLSTAHTTGSPQARQLKASAESFEGKLKCKFDSPAPLNVTDLNQSFIIDCEEIKGPYDYTWVYVVVGVVGGCVVLRGLYVYVPRWVRDLKATREKRRERKRQEAIDEAEAPPAGHPYALA